MEKVSLGTECDAGSNAVTDVSDVGVNDALAGEPVEADNAEGDKVIPVAGNDSPKCVNEDLKSGDSTVVESGEVARNHPLEARGNPFGDEGDDEVNGNQCDGVSEPAGRTHEATKRGSLNPFDDDFVEAVKEAKASDAAGGSAQCSDSAGTNKGKGSRSSAAVHPESNAARDNTKGGTGAAARPASLTADFIAYGNVSTSGDTSVDGLVEYGFAKQQARVMLEKHGNDPGKAFGALCDIVKNIQLKQDGREMQAVWSTPITARLVSWINGNDHCGASSGSTTYVICVKHHYTNKVWNVERTYDEFAALNLELRAHIRNAFPLGMHYPFPTEWMIAYWFGITDEIRKDRLDRIDKWLREIYLNPLMALQSTVRKWLITFLNIGENVLPPKAKK